MTASASAGPMVPVDAFSTSAVILCVTLNACIAASLAVAMPVYLTTELQVSYAATSAFLVAGALTTTLVAHGIGKLSDTGASRHAIAVTSCLSGVIGFALLAMADTYSALLLVFATFIAVANSLFPQFMALAFVLSPRRVPTARAFASLGWVVGPPVTGLVIAATSYQVAFASIAFLYIGLIAVVAFLAVRASLPAGRSSPKGAANYDQGRAFGRRRDVIDLVILLSSLHLLMAIPLIGVPLLITEQGGQEVHVGLAFGIAAAIEIPIIAATNRIRAWASPHVLFVACGWLLAAYFVLLALSSSYVTVIAASVLNGVVTGLMMGLGLVLLQERLSDAPGLASAIYTNVLRLTHVAALLVTGLVAELSSLSAVLLVCGLGAGGLATGLSVAHARRRASASTDMGGHSA